MCLHGMYWNLAQSSIHRLRDDLQLRVRVLQGFQQLWYWRPHRDALMIPTGEQSDCIHICMCAWGGGYYVLMHVVVA